jgi:putative ABC transport system substrate-binding protein
MRGEPDRIVTPAARKARRARVAPTGVLAATIALAVLGAPLPVQAQRQARIGYLSPLSAGADAAQLEAFRQGLRALGRVEGQDIVIETRHADTRFERLPDLAAELARPKVDVIVTSVTPAVRAVQQATRTIPVVMAFSADPVGDRFVANLARPGGNVTGLSAAAGEMTVKRIEFLKAIAPSLSHVSYLANPQITRRVVTESESAGRALGLRVSTLFVRDSNRGGAGLLDRPRGRRGRPGRGPHPP